jgi:signal transduction histidine kinase
MRAVSSILRALSRVRSACLGRDADTRLWRAYGGAMAVLAVAYFWVGRGSNFQTVIYLLFGWSSVVAILVGVRRYRPLRDRHWVLFAGGLSLWSIGDIYWYVYPLLLHREAAYPSFGDYLWLAGYPLFAAAVLVLIRGWGRPRLGDLLDGAIVFVGAALVAALFLLEPLVHSSSSTPFGTAVSIAYPAIDLVLLIGLAQLAFRGRLANPSLRCIVVGMVALAIADAVYSFLTVKGAYVDGAALDAGWLINYALWGVAALHPSMRSIRSLPKERDELSRGRIGVLVVALLSAPVGLLVVLVSGSHDAHLVALEVSVGWIVTTLLVGVRVGLLQRERQRGQAALALSERRYRSLFREADQARMTLADQNDRLLELDRLKDNLIACVSHELRTPLTSMVGYLELVSEEADRLSEEQRMSLGVVDRNAERLLRLVTDLLFVAQVKAGALKLEKDMVNVSRLVEAAVEAARPAAANRPVELTLRVTDDARVVGDLQRLGQVIDNLVSNALKFTLPGGSVLVTVDARDDTVEIAVADTGIGIPAAEQAEVFSHFFRTEAAEQQAIQGTGLGLSIVKTIVEGHGGRIEVQSAEGEGSTFRVVLPRGVVAAKSIEQEAA